MVPGNECGNDKYGNELDLIMEIALWVLERFPLAFRVAVRYDKMWLLILNDSPVIVDKSRQEKVKTNCESKQ